ncbi:hypothetical protein [Bacillus mycoides]|uniref:hypothetical protein n=1 Tax=Bacillus mycoides TaxID=1405 RepID=UPI0003E1C9A9|nr:hypothetical protein [Bacillus mycoides]ETT83478.1 hypothetical protein C174_04618 [Bacillus mycoides FSL H7-687]MCQ6533986.1 hypothetical protein [Bacillus mycoides]QWI11371.1 hypothetical protein EXW47_13685 [Bacillus mycoides]QWI55828.1 hypothetical protein EXW42_17405 [Bacillus mycoides]QWI92423.1 hypothetical protein J5W00_13425 [Bacillus mycoides]
MNFLSGIILFSYFFIATISYYHLYKSRNLIGYHLGMNIAMLSSTAIGLAVGAVLGSQFPLDEGIITIITTLIAVAVGIVFGALVDYQTLLTGVSSGIMSGLMGPMLGLHSTQPAFLIICTTVVVFLSFILLRFSVRT